MKLHNHECSGCKVFFECDREDCGGKLYQYFSSCNDCTYARMQAFASPRKALALVVIFALLGFPFAQLRAQEQEHRQIHVPERVSRSVFEQAGNAMKVLHTKQLMGQATAIDYAIAGANAQTMFAHMDETGLTKEIESYILANPTRFTEFPNEPELQESFSKVPEEQRLAFVQYVRANGLADVHRNIIRMFQDAAASALKNQNSPFRLAQCTGAGRVGWWAGWASLYIGVTGYVLMMMGPIGWVGDALFWAGLGLSGISFAANNC